MPDTTVAEDSGDILNYRDLNDVFGDVEDGTALTYTAISSDSALITPAVDVADSTLDLTLGANVSGTATITVRAADVGGLWVEDIFDVVVTSENDAPVVALAMPDTTVAEDSGDILNYRDLNSVFADDEDGTSLTFTVESSMNPLLIPIVDLIDSTLDMALGANENGTATITVRATDGGGLWVEDVFDVVVTPENDAPVALDDGPYTLAEGATLNEPLATGVLANDSDPDVGDVLGMC
jgi:hypothetical protein